jgi:GNAT superfamily N-acetyltransferase
MSVTVRALAPEEIAQAVGDLARLRIAVFREWPYLYDGSTAYESDYLRNFAAAPDPVLIAAFDGDAIIGMATASPLAAQDDATRAPLEAAGFDVPATFYFGESVLLPDYRGQGIGHRFFDLREAGARAAGAQVATFCAVVRPDDHPRRPADARDLTPFWQARGYRPVAGAEALFSWTDLGDAERTPHLMRFWSCAL